MGRETDQKPAKASGKLSEPGMENPTWNCETANEKTDQYLLEEPRESQWEQRKRYLDSALKSAVCMRSGYSSEEMCVLGKARWEEQEQEAG